MDVLHLRNTYNKIARDYYNDHKNDRWNDYFFQYFSENVIPGGKILDLGCGPGIASAKLTEKGFEVFGIDFSPGLLDIARKNLPQVHFVEGNIMEPLPYELDFFDGIYAHAVLLHIPHAEARK